MSNNERSASRPGWVEASLRQEARDRARDSGFDRFTRFLVPKLGSPIVFVLAALVVVVWAATGAFFGWSDGWQLVINTASSIVTFLMVFVIQNSQTRDTQALQLKLDELIRVSESARNSLISLEDRPAAEVGEVKSEFAALDTGNEPSCGGAGG